MNYIDIFLIGIALSMDAFAVSVTNTLVYKKYSPIAIALFFGAFQGLMPLGGFFAGSVFSAFISRYSGLISLIILGFIGGKMIWDCLHPDEVDCSGREKLTYKILFLQAIATSIDAFAIGVSFVGESFITQQAGIFMPALTIAIITFCLSMLAVQLGKRTGNLFGDKMELIGGAILILIGIKNFLF
ncbi:MAG: manganese efflux pump [Firmicutes bacterium]|nr:manganese efflux pump [Bacillota bacterium]